MGVMDIQVTVLLLICGLTRFQSVAQGSEFYTAAVVEYSPFEMRPGDLGNPSRTMRKNALNYMYFMEQAARQGADIIVFPECGITGIKLPSSREELRPYLTEIPEPRSQSNPCLDASANSSELLKDLSCASRMYRIYTVINLPEMAACAEQDGVATSSCPEDGVFIYNTNVVLDRNGSVVARYRKYNLYLEPGFDTEPTAGLSMFDTDFGVRFGMFICFDILFRQPAVAMVTGHNITDVVYSTAWFSELPFLTAVQIQAAWSYATDTNFLASGYSNPSNKNTGSGIFAGRNGVVTSVMAFDKLNRLLVAKVNKKSKIRAREEETDTGHGARTKQHEGTLVTITEKGKDGNQLPAPCNLLSRSLKEESFQKKSEDSLLPYGHLKIYQEDISHYNTSLMGSQNINKQLNLCHGSFCCQFYIGAEIENINSTVEEVQKVKNSQLNSNNGYYFRIGVFEGVRPFGEVTIEAGLQVCAIFACTTQDIASCGLLKNETKNPETSENLPETTETTNHISVVDDVNNNGIGSLNERVVLKRLEIKGYFEKDNLIMPNTLTTDLLPFKGLDFEFSSESDQRSDIHGKSKTFVTMKASGKALDGMLTFGIYARYFQKDKGIL